jgi:hypothetical protein
MVCSSLKTGLTPKLILFDFTHYTTHLGDRLFFLPLFQQLLSDGFDLRLAHNDDISIQLFSTLNEQINLKSCDPTEADLIVVPKPSYLARFRFQNLVIVDFTCRKVTNKISIELIYKFYEFLGFKKIDYPTHLSLDYKIIESSLLSSDNKYIIFSNYIHSGRFRKLFVDESKLYDKCLTLRKLGYKIVHVGTKKDRDSDIRLYGFVDIDARGKLSIIQFLSLVADKQVVGVVTYDNFLLHLAGIFKKQAYILFRGRFVKANEKHHIDFVNNNFYSDNKMIEYL